MVEPDGLHFNGPYFKGSDNLGKIELQLPGIHNVKNSLAALAVGLELEVPFAKIRKALSSFTGVHRRFEIKGNKRGVIVVDDYAHHPTEIKASLRAARLGWSKRIIVVFQPHLFSRTRDFYHDFGQSFFDADQLIVTEIYPAREEPIPDVTGRLVSDEAKSLGHRHVHFIPSMDDVMTYLIENISDGDMVITMGAGDIWKVGDNLLKSL